MKSEGKFLLYLSAGAAELVWLYACASFVTIPLLDRPFPLPEAIGIFTLAALLTRIVRGRGLRVIMILGVHLLGLLLVASKVIHILFYGDQPFGAHWWLWESLSGPKEPLVWCLHIISLFMVVVFWTGGVTLSRRSVNYITICSRFDMGVLAFFVLLLIKFLVLLKGGADMWGVMPELLLFPFFLFGLLTIALARNRGTARRSFLSGYHAIGMMVSATAVLLAFGTGVVLLFLPYLSAAADRGYGLLKSAAAPLGPLFVRIIRFIFGHERVRLAAPLSHPEGTGGVASSVATDGWWGDIIEKIVGWGVLGLGVILAATAFVLGLWLLLRWLASRTEQCDTQVVRWHAIMRRLRDVWMRVCLCRERIASMARGCRDAIDLYRGLCRWGRHSGISRRWSETPREYGLRLRRRFPQLEREIETIAESFNREVYGERDLDAVQLERAKSGWNRMRSPRYWPCRWKSLFPGGRSLAGT